MRWESRVLLWLQDRVRFPFLTTLFTMISRTTDGGILWLLISLGLLVFKKTRYAGIVCLATILAEFIIVNLFVKNIVARTRPFERIEGLNALVSPPDDFSFPSGHTGVAFATASAMLFLGYTRAGIGLICYATLVGLSRIYLGVHYPTDVFGGAILGVLIAFGVHLLAA